MPFVHLSRRVAISPTPMTRDGTTSSSPYSFGFHGIHAVSSNITGISVALLYEQHEPTAKQEDKTG
jgi:hypothetical protein